MTLVPILKEIAVSILHQWINNTINEEDTSINVDINKDFKIATE